MALNDINLLLNVIVMKHTTHCMQPGTPPGPEAGIPPGPGTPCQAQCMLGDTATSGRYASYWNAILL